MITTLIAAVSMAAPAMVDDKMVCAVMGGPANAKVGKVDYAGARFGFCCNGCPEAFTEDPVKALKNPALKGKTFGEFLFDPVSHSKISATTAKGGSMAYAGIKYYFATAANLATFKKNPGSFTTTPGKELLTCPVSGEKIAGYGAAAGFADKGGVRFYFCCPDCIGAFAKDGDKFASKNAAKASAPKALPAEAAK